MPEVESRFFQLNRGQVPAVVTAEKIWSHFYLHRVNGEAAEAAVKLERICPSSPDCNIIAVHNQAVKAINGTLLSGAEAGISTVPMTGPPTSGRDLILGAVVDEVTGAVLDREKRKIQEEQTPQEKQQPKEEEETEKEKRDRICGKNNEYCG